MKVKVDAPLLNAAGRSIMALAGFPGSDKKEKANTHCLLTAEGDKLIVEAADLGIYIKHILPATVVSAGTAAINAGILNKIRSLDFVSLTTKGKKAKSLLVRYGSTKSEIDMPDKVEESIVNSRPSGGSKINAQIPIELMKESLKAVTFKPGLKEESVRLQFSVNPKQVEVTGLDSYSFARVLVTDKTMFSCKKRFAIVLRSNVLTNILKEMEQEEGKVKISVITNKKKEAKTVRLKSKTFEVYYPTLGVSFVDLRKEFKSLLAKQRVNARFESTKQNLVEVIANCCSLHSSEETGGALKLKFDIAEKMVTVSTDSAGAKTRTELKPSSCKVKGKKKAIYVHEGYLSSFLSLAPEGVPLRIESCGEAFLKLVATSLESGSIEYLVARVAAPSKRG